MRILYVSYNGLLEPIGRSQVFGYVLAQSARHSFVVISFEKPEERQDGEKVVALASRLRNAGATWIPLPYLASKPRSLAAALNLLRGIVRTLVTARRQSPDVIHARSYLGALIALPSSVLLRIPFLFDMRGFWPDEGVGVGRWAEGAAVHRLLKSLERILLRHAGAMVTLTDSGARHLIERFPDAGGGRPIAVIPTCADITRFRPSEHQAADTIVLGYVGSANEAYLFEEFVQVFLQLRRRRPDARMLILNRKDHDYVRRTLHDAGILPASFEIRGVDHEQVPEEIRRMTLGTIFVRPYLAKIGSAPTKMAEFLASGVPCLGNAGCGDVAEILETERVGVAIDTFSAEAIEQMVDRALLLLNDPRLARRCRDVANRRFSMDTACVEYDRLYAAIRRPVAMATS